MPPARVAKVAERRPVLRWFTPAAMVLLAWGALAFGAEYAWAYAPLLVFGAVLGAVGLAVPGPPRRWLRPLGAALGVVFVAGALQVAPLPEPVLRAVSPARTAHDYDAEKAKACLELMPDFIDDAIGLYQTITGAAWE